MFIKVVYVDLSQGNALSNLGMFDKAIEMYEASLKINPFNKDAYYNYG